MKKVKSTKFLDVIDGYFISNTGGTSIDEVSYDECYHNPPMRVYYAKSKEGKEPINEDIRQYCFLPNYWREADIIGSEGVDGYKFLKKNIVSIMRGEISEWHLFGIDITPYAAYLRFITVDYDMYHLELAAQRQKLNLLFELERTTKKTERFLYSTWNTVWQDRRTHIVEERASNRKEMVMSKILWERYEDVHPNSSRLPVKVITYL